LLTFSVNISAKYYENPTMLSRVVAEKHRGCFFETQCIHVGPFEGGGSVSAKFSR